MQFNFDPNDVYGINKSGNAYPTAEISDKWGQLKVTGGWVLLSDDYDKIHVSSSAMTCKDNIIKGNGWTLTLNKSYKLQKTKEGSYKVTSL